MHERYKFSGKRRFEQNPRKYSSQFQKNQGDYEMYMAQYMAGFLQYLQYMNTRGQGAQGESP